MGDMIKGDSKAPSTDVSTAQRVQAVSRYLPMLMQSLNSQVGPTEQNLMDVNKQISPQEQALNAQLYATYAPQYAAVDAASRSGADLASVTGAGGQASMAAQALQRQIDPEYYATRANTSQKLMDLVNNPISGSESASIERANNRGQIANGTYDVNNNANALTSAMNFGAAGRDRLGQALSLATQSMPAMRSAPDVFAQATGKGAQSNPIGQVGLTQQNLGQSVYGTGNSLLGGITQQQGNEQNINANRRTVYDAVNQSYTAAGSGTSGFASSAGSCCWIFLESYHGKLPESVRLCRDYFYEKSPAVASGYKRMAKWLVPLMQESKIVRSLVWNLMVKPITQYGEYLTGSVGKCRGRAHFKFWSAIWEVQGA